MVTLETLEALNIDYSFGDGDSSADYPSLEEKFTCASTVVKTALETYANPVVLWTGGKDSTLIMHVVSTVLDENPDLSAPAVAFIDHGQHFPAVRTFVNRWSVNWGLPTQWVQNTDVELLGTIGEDVAVADLTEENQREVARLDYTEDTFPRSLNTLVGNHLMKTVPLNDLLTEFEYDGVITGVRWDEQDARAEESFFSPRHDSEKYPPHDRVHPILQFEEKDVWDGMWEVVVPESVDGFPLAGLYPKSGSPEDLHGFDISEIPVCELYFEGYRSLGGRDDTDSSELESEPAWLQEFTESPERAGRGQDKEDLMERLRDLGYM